MTVKKIDIPISMLERSDCDDCVSRFRQQVAHLEGVIDASPNVAAGTVRLSYDSSILDIEELRSRAEQIGIDLESRFGHETYRLEGMHCADCARSIVAVAERQPGVVSANASFASSTLRVEYERQRADMGRLVRQIEQLGYPVAGRGAPPAKREWLTVRTALSALSGVVLVAGVGAEYLGSLSADLLYGASCALAAPYLLKGAFAALRARVVETDFLMSAAAAGAIYLGDWREAAAVVFLYTLGETLEGLSVARARRAIRALAEGFPAFCSVLENGVEREVPVEDVQPGQVVIVRPGQMNPVDGRVASGASEVDESLVTGESVPVSKVPGDAVIAGSLNGSGSLQVVCERASADNTVNRIVAMVEEAQGQRSPSERTSERFGRVYTPVVLVTAAAMAVGGPLVAGQAFDESFRRALVLLTVSCPCALILSAPVAVVSAIAAAASSGVLIKGGAALEALGRTKTLALDKTGTVTLARLRVTDVVPIEPASREQLLRVVASLEAHSEHVVARAVSEFVREAGVKAAEVSDFVSSAGKGVTGTLDGKRALVGSVVLMNESGLSDERVESEVERFARSGKITLVAAYGDVLVGIVALSDQVRPEAADVIRQVQRLGVGSVTLLTGDRPEAAGTIAALVGVSAVAAGLKPEDKLAQIANMSDASGAVAMVGDGINDAPALARADVGISIGSAATATRHAADVVLLGGDLTGLPYALELGQKTLATIRVNLAFSVLVVLTLVGLTLAGRLTLTQGVLGHEGSSLAVVANGLRLLGRRRKAERENTGDHRHHEHQEGCCSSG